MTPVARPVTTDDIVERLTEEMRDRWQAGDRVIVENALAQYPELQSDPGAIGELLFEEICLRREFGEPGISAEILQRFPALAPQIRVLLAVRDAFVPDQEPTELAAGEIVGEFAIVREIGRGVRGRVYMATQPSLADRTMVLKVTRRNTTEHCTLARLQHTYIVPLYSVFDDPVRDVRVLCMPDFGGATLAQVLELLEHVTPFDRTGVATWAALTGRKEPSPPPDWWASSDYVGLVCRIVLCLAEALQFAHERNLLHLDVKPSNILITAEGLPMLLDFHLAREPIRAGELAPFVMGGTDPYLSPEHRSAWEAVRNNRTVATSIDGRTDIYSLGVVLYEALAGQRPSPGKIVPLSRLNPLVSIGLSDLVARCLAPRVDDRYPSASSLADDLRRHLAGQLLSGVRNRSIAERWRKWRRRRPHALGSVVGFIALLLAVTLGVGYVDHRRAQVRSALAEGRAELALGRIPAARGAFQRGLAVGVYLPDWEGHTRELNQGITQVDHAERLGELHVTAERLRGLLGSDTLSQDDLASAEPLGRLLRERRSDFFDAVESAAPDSTRQQARADAVELVLLWSLMSVRLAPTERAMAARREAVELLSNAERTLGPHPALALDRAEYLDALGRPDEARAARKRAEETPPLSASDHFTVGCCLYRQGQTVRATKEFDRAVELDPRSYWSWFLLGRCHFINDRMPEAAVAFGICTGLDSNNPSGYIQKAILHSRLGQHDDALRCLDHALHLDKNNAIAMRLKSEYDHIR